MVPAPERKTSLTDKSANKVPWNPNSADGHLLKMVLGSKLSKGAMAKSIMDDYPDFVSIRLSPSMLFCIVSGMMQGSTCTSLLLVVSS